LLQGGLDSKLQHYDLVKFLEEKKKKTSHLDSSVHIEDDIIQNHKEKNKKWNKVKNQDFMGKANFFLSTQPFHPWAVLAKWLHVVAPQKI
jgi:hypothetical protein